LKLKKQVKKFIALILVMAFAFAVVGCGGGDKEPAPADNGDKAPAEAITLHWGATSSPEHSYATVSEDFINAVKERTNGSVIISPEFAGVHGGERQMTESVMRGDLDMEMTSDVGLAALFPDLGFTQLPFLFKDYDDVDARYLNGWMGEVIEKRLAEKGIIVLGWGENDYRALTNSKHPISGANDLEGLKIRVPEIPMYIEFFKQLGALPTPMAVTELPTALQQKTIDGQDNGAILTYSYGYYQFQPYMTKLQHIYSGTVLIISEKTWNKLSEEQQNIIAEEAEKYCAAQLERNRADVAEFYQNMEEKGVEIIEPSPELIARAQEIGKNIMNDPKNDELYGKDVMDRLRAGE
jgi:tripartite ATP-independent transporter DctP family solute receptor